MGFDGTFIYGDGIWGADASADPRLAIDVHDSDIATVDYRAEGEGGRFYLGFEPRDYFGDPDASDPIDPDDEAERFAAWSQRHLGAQVTAAQIRPLIAAGDEPEDDFVEETVARLLDLLGLPPPEGLPG